MNTSWRWVLVLVVMMVVMAPTAYAEEVLHLWACELDEGATEQQVEEMAEEWLEAARTMDGGKNLNLTVLFPVAVNATGDVDFHLVLSAPSFTEWGTFWDAYDDDSPASKVEAKYEEQSPCPDSAVWEAVPIDPK